jgi:hypothetical protein
MYSFGSNVTNEFNIPETLFIQPLFQAHTRLVVKTLETALGLMMGHDMGTLALALQGLGARHVNYGVQPPHYGIVETALLRTLAAALGEAHWTMNLRKDWAAVFKFVAKAMEFGASNEMTIIKEENKARARRSDGTIRVEFAMKHNNTRWETAQPQAPSLPTQPRRSRGESPPRQPRRHSENIILSHTDMNCLECEEEEKQDEHASTRLKSITKQPTRWEAEQPIPPRNPVLPSRTREDSPPGMPRRHSDADVLVHLDSDVYWCGFKKGITGSPRMDPRQRKYERRSAASLPSVG